MKDKTVKNVIEEIKEFQSYARSFGFENLNNTINRFKIISETEEEYNICYIGNNEMQIKLKKNLQSHVILCYILTWYEAEFVRDMIEIDRVNKTFTEEFQLIKKKLEETTLGFFYYREGH